ncbi:hypothetical protein IGI37_000079 [Enterococcus sp. AZ194]|uniref:hypothetical protein n=1 Tax=Enterococcus sp. AZ194 TaxID=2774629 RepID=UPI003F1F33AA
MSELEKIGRNLMEIALQYTHQNFEGMYPDWGAVCNIGEELVRMSNQPQLNENQQLELTYDEMLTIVDWFNGYCFRYYGVDAEKVQKELPKNHKSLINRILQVSGGIDGLDMEGETE